MLNTILIVSFLILIIYLYIIAKKIRPQYKKIAMLIILILTICWANFLTKPLIQYYNSKFVNGQENSRLEEEISNIDEQIQKINKAEKNYKGNSNLNAEEREAYLNEYQKLNNDISIKNQELTSVTDTFNDLKKKYDDLYAQTSHLINNAPTYHQYPDYPNGCESVALWILLTYNGVKVTMPEIIDILPMGSSPFYVNGVRYGGNPEREFVGDPRLYSGYGVYEKPIIQTAEHFKSGVIDKTGTSLGDILKLVKENKPVQVWASINLKDTSVCTSWLDEDTKEKVEWICDLHSMVIFGYDYKNIIVSDPYTGKIEYYEKQQFEKMYNLFGKRALYYEN